MVGATGIEPVTPTMSTRQVMRHPNPLSANQSLKGAFCHLRVKAILSDCERVAERRNQLTHGPWEKFLDGDPVLYRHTGATLPIPSAQELRALAHEIHELALTLNDARLEGFLKVALMEADAELLTRGSTQVLV